MKNEDIWPNYWFSLSFSTQNRKQYSFFIFANVNFGAWFCLVLSQFLQLLSFVSNISFHRTIFCQRTHLGIWMNHKFIRKSTFFFNEIRKVFDFSIFGGVTAMVHIHRSSTELTSSYTTLFGFRSNIKWTRCLLISH